MSTRNLLKTGAGLMRPSQKITKGQEEDSAKRFNRAISGLNSFMRDITRKINGRLSFGDASQSSSGGNIYGQWIEFITPGTPDLQFKVDHGLQKNVVARIVMRQDKAAHLYDSNLGGWGDDAVYFKCDVASVLFKVFLLADPDS
jgi:hypothetical protein